MKFKLFVSRDSLNSNRAIANLRRIGEEDLEGCFELEIVDVQEDPGAARRHRIYTTPSLIVEDPCPELVAYGDLSDRARLLEQLGISQRRDSLSSSLSA